MNITINLNGDFHFHIEADALLDLMEEMPEPPCEPVDEHPAEVTDEEAVAIINVLAKLFRDIGAPEGVGHEGV